MTSAEFRFPQGVGQRTGARIRQLLPGRHHAATASNAGSPRKLRKPPAA
jgi:hypothetical protein